MTIALTQFSHGAGCGCKIAPALLQKILASAGPAAAPDSRLLVGNDERDDAAVYQLNESEAVISTTDFFMPIVDDPKTFGRIAATNAISDIYAMGGTPLMAIAILGWPINQLDAAVAGEVLEGGRQTCAEAGIPLAGGHSIDSPEPIFGLAVTGRLKLEHLKRNGGATAGCQLYLTKPLGVGILTTAQKRGLVTEDDLANATRSMLTLNAIGETLGRLPAVQAMTDVTGFGLLGHLLEMCEASDLGAVLDFDRIPRFPRVDHYLALDCSPGGTDRNWDSYGAKVGPLTPAQIGLLADPQTSGGLLVAVDPAGIAEFLRTCQTAGLDLEPIGELVSTEGPLITLR